MILGDPHPPLTVFPAALLTVVCILEIYYLVRPTRRLRALVRTNLWFGLIGTIAAFFSGYVASEGASARFVVAEDLIGGHHGWGRALLFLMIPCVALEVFEERAVRGRGWFFTGYLVFLFLSFIVMVQTCYLGGVLVFEHGAGVRGGIPVSQEGASDRREIDFVPQNLRGAEVPPHRPGGEIEGVRSERTSAG